MLVRSWLDALKVRFIRQPTRRERRAARPSRPLHVESLEDRRLMAFDPAVGYPVGQLPTGVAAGLINGDTALDLVTAINSDNTVSVLLNQGNGSFAAAVSYPVGPSPFDAATGDFNRDGRADVVTANYEGNSVSVLLNQGNATLGTAVSYAAGTAPTSVVVADLNGDSKLDLAVTNYNNSNIVSLLLGNGDGTFQAARALAAGGDPISVVVGDFDGDHKLDLATANYSGSSVSVFKGDGLGNFEAPKYSSVPGPTSLAVGDVNKDGTLDLLVAGAESIYHPGGCGYYGCYPGYWGAQGQANVLIGQGDGTFAPGTSFQLGSTILYGTAAADFNGDGWDDFAVDYRDGGGVNVYLNQGDGGWFFEGFHATGDRPSGIIAADLNGDTHPDLALVNFGSASTSVLINDGYWPPLDAPSISITDVTVTEGNSGTATATFNVNLSEAYTQPVSIHYATASGTAVAGSDFVAVEGTLTFTPGQISQPITVLVTGDVLAEDTEAFYVGLTSPVNTFVADAQGVGTILDNEPCVSIDFGPVYVTEGNTGTTNSKFTLRLSAPYELPVKVNLSVVEGDTDFYIGDWYYGNSYPPATLNTDFVGGLQTITFNPGDLTKEITVPVKGDRNGEPDEYFLVNVNSTDYGTIVSPQAVGIIDDDEPVAYFYSSAGVVEGHSGSKDMVFTVLLSAPYDAPFTVEFNSVDAGATAGSDYQATTGSVTFEIGQTVQSFSIPVYGDRLGEYDENFYVILADGYFGSTTGSILDDEPRISINYASLTEGNSGTKLMTFTVTLSAAYDQTVTVNYATQDNSAVTGQDYVATSGTLTFAPGQTSKTITVAIKGDRTKEDDEYFYVFLSDASSNALLSYWAGIGSILNDDPGKSPRR